MQRNGAKSWLKGILSGGGIVIYFIMALEVMIMISPFAFFFYSVFNPILHFLGQYSVTRWLTGFFLPHMIFPPSVFLEGLRVLGSVLFLLGLALFLVCAFQVYVGKIFKLGIATKGPYQLLRHPQYLGLAICGIGMAILWPRFLVLMTLSLMLVLYYFLASDEERRMISEHGDDYRRYLEGTGMFLPRWIERPVSSVVLLHDRLKPYRSVVYPVVIVSATLIAGFTLRAFTLAELPLKVEGNLAIVSMLPEDNGSLKSVARTLSGIEGKPQGDLVLNQNEEYLGYLMPVDYVMQGMIANTGERWQLYKTHHTLAMISDWVFHPFRHLRQAPMHLEHMPAGHNPAMARRHHCPLAINDPALECSDCPYRRVVLVRVEAEKQGSPRQLFALNAKRTAVGYFDIDIRSGEIVDASKVQGETAWEEVPTPIF